MKRALTIVGLTAVLMLVSLPAGAGGGGGCRGFDEATRTEIVASGNCFRSTVAHVSIGDEVTWRNDDAWQHNIVTTAFDGTENLSTHSVTFDRAGVYPYVCTIHHGMVGAVVVHDATDAPAKLAAPAAGAAEQVPASMAVSMVGAGLMLGVGVLLGRARGRRLLDRPER